jgi:hypothetical protein
MAGKVTRESRGDELTRLEATEHFRRWRQEKVAKIVQCGEALAEKNRTSS